MHEGRLQRCLRRMKRIAAVVAVTLIPACHSFESRQPGPPVVEVEPNGGGDLLIRAGHMQSVSASGTNQAVTSPEMEAAEQLFQEERYGEAYKQFRVIAKNTKNPPLLAEKAGYFEAESLRLQGYYPDAVDVYHRTLQDFPSGVYREQAVTRMFHIANYWLDDTRAEMDAQQEKEEGKRWFVMPALFHTDRTKPMMDVEGRALKTLEIVHYSDITGPNADKALWLCGYVNFYRGNFREADHYLSQLIDHHKDSKLRPQAIELAIMAKNNSTGGSLYDGRKSDEARKLIHQAQANCPELVTKRGDFLDRQLFAINYQQADKTYNIAEFYRRTHHPGSAYFYYDLVRRQYPGTKHAQMATQRMNELRSELMDAKAKGEPGLGGPDWFARTRIQFNKMFGEPEPVIAPVEVPPEVLEAEGATPRKAPEVMQKPIPQEFLPR